MKTILYIILFLFCFNSYSQNNPNLRHATSKSESPKLKDSIPFEDNQKLNFDNEKSRKKKKSKEEFVNRKK